MLPVVNTQAMQLHLDEISRHIARKAHGVVLMDRAGWHTSGELKVPSIARSLICRRARWSSIRSRTRKRLRANWLSKSYGRNWVMRPVRRRGDPVSQ